MPSATRSDRSGLVAVGADLEPGTLLAAYASGLFPMPIALGDVGWWSPNPRGVLPLDSLRVSKSLARSCRRYQVRFNTSFQDVMVQCGDPQRPHGWITQPFIDAYVALHEMGWVHSVEAWLDGQLVGGLYGVRINGFFAGESMFHNATDASKVALVALVEWLNATSGQLLDVQWTTPHLVSLGAIDVPQRQYLRLLQAAINP